MRRSLFFGALAFGTLVVATVGRAEACASIWTLDAPRLSPCCRAASGPRITKPGGDCCDFRDLEERDPGASSGAPAVPPAQWARVAIETIVPPAPVTRHRHVDARIPERPPDRALATIVLLI